MKENNNKSVQKLLELFDIAKYADRIEDEKVFRNAELVIYNQFYKYLHSLSQDNESINQGVRFTDEQIDLIKSVTRQICKPERNFFSSSTLLISIWFPPTKYIPYHLETWRQLWYVLTNVIDAGKDDWFMTYWSFADQYFRFQLDCGRHNALRENDELFKEQQKRFKEFHMAVQSYILYKEKYDLLSKVLNFSHVYPKDYILTDNTLNDIVEDVMKFNNKGYGYLSSNYMMSGLSSDVNSDERIFGIIARYFAVLLYRLHSLDNNTPLNHYDVSEINQNEVSSLNCAIESILILQYWVSDESVKKATEKLGFNYSESKEIQELLDKYKEELIAKKEDLLTHPTTNPEKIKEIKKRLIENAVEAIRVFSVPRDSDSCLNVETDEKIFTCSANVELQLGDIGKNIPKLSVNVEDTLIHALSVQEQNCYCQYFLFNKPYISYSIRFEDIPMAFEKLCLDDKTVIVSLGVQLSAFRGTLGGNPHFSMDNYDNMIYDNKVNIIEMPSTMAAIAVIKRSDLPYMTHVPCDKEEMECIKEDKAMLYSNIDDIDVNNRNLKVKWYSKLTMRKDFTRYIMLNVKYLSDSSILDIEKIQPFDTLIPGAGIQSYVNPRI